MIWGVLSVVAAILIAVAARIISDDVKEWLPCITRCLIERAVSRLPEGERERLEEEWWSHVNERPGGLAKIYVAYGYLSASKSIDKIVRSGESLPLAEPVSSACTLKIVGNTIQLVRGLSPLDNGRLSFTIIATQNGVSGTDTFDVIVVPAKDRG
jgi:hypothetical protein